MLPGNMHGGPGNMSRGPGNMSRGQGNMAGVQETWLGSRKQITDTGDDLRRYQYGQKYQYFH